MKNALQDKPAQRPTLRDLARTLNVSHTTVSRALSGQGADFISAETRARVRKATKCDLDPC